MDAPECKPLKEQYDSCYNDWYKGKKSAFGLHECNAVFEVSYLLISILF